MLFHESARGLGGPPRFPAKKASSLILLLIPFTARLTALSRCGSKSENVEPKRRIVTSQKQKKERESLCQKVSLQNFYTFFKYLDNDKL